MKDAFEKLVTLTSGQARCLLDRICMDPASFNYGGFVHYANYADSRNSIYEAQNLFASYLMPGLPEFFGKPEVLTALRAHLQFMTRRQHEDGSVNLGATGGGGFEVGFTLPGVCETYRRALQSDLPGREEILATLKDYILRGAKAVREGFAGTANHRWTAIAAPLAAVNRLFPDPANGAVIEDYLADGIDMDEFGMYYEERSPNYDGVANWGLIMLADYWGRKDLLDHVERSLNFTLAMRQPCGEAATLFSHRQDRGVAGKIGGDYYLFKRLAIEKQNGVFASAADMHLDGMLTAGRHGEYSTPFIPLIYLDEDFGLSREKLERQPLPTTADIRFKRNPIWRWRKGPIASTVVADKGGHFWDATDGGLWGCPRRSASFLDYHHGEAAVDAVRIHWGNGSGCFRPEGFAWDGENSLQMSYVDPGAIHLSHFRREGKRAKRRLPHGQEAGVRLTRQADDSVVVCVKIGGWKDMPINVQLLLRETGSLLHPDGRKTSLEQGGRTFTAGGDYVLSQGDSGILITGLPKSILQLGVGDGYSITGVAEQRCHRLIVSVVTPVNFTFSLSPARG